MSVLRYPTLRGLHEIPHEDDLWISTDDTMDYAAWLDRRVKELDGAFKKPEALAKPAVYTWGATEWVPWWLAWNLFHEQLKQNWTDRLNSWETVKQRHRELVELRAKALVAGVAAPPLDPTPKDPEAKLAGGVANAVGGITTGAVALGVGAVAIVLFALYATK